MSHVKVQQVLKSFMLVGFIKEGTKDGNNKTYYYTEEGKEHFASAFGYDDEQIVDLIANYDDLTEEYNKMIDKENEELKRIKLEKAKLKESDSKIKEGTKC